MRSLLDPSSFNEEVLQKIWQDKLPPTVRQSLATLPLDTPLDEIAVVADKVIPHVPKQLLATTSVRHPSPPQEQTATNELTEDIKLLISELRRGRSQRPPSPHPSRSSKSELDLCWYHRRFGSSAKKCNPPCSFIKHSKHLNFAADQ